MPSYRLVLAVGTLGPGVDPATVLPTAAAAARERVTVEAFDVEVVRGQARVVVRYSADDDAQALAAGRGVRAVVSGMAHVTDSAITRRYGARWYACRDS